MNDTAFPSDSFDEDSMLTMWPGAGPSLGRTDQYALGCVLYELLSGAPPFSGVFETGDPMIMMAAVKGETPEEIDDLPPRRQRRASPRPCQGPEGSFPNLRGVRGGAGR